jgi:DNA-binding FrmR family transcriptional regulator
MLSTAGPRNFSALATLNLRTHLLSPIFRIAMYTLGGILRFNLREVKMTRRANSVVLRDQEQLEEVFKRVKRAEGQIAGVIRMLEDGRNCEEIVHQMAAVGKAMNTAAITLISSSLEECMSEKKNNQAQRERLLKLFMSLA